MIKYNKIICTYFDDNYLDRGLTLIKSISQDSSLSDFAIVVLYLGHSLEDFTKYIGSFKNDLTIISLKDIFEFDSRLIDVQNSRKKVEFYFTLTPFLLKIIMRKYLDHNGICYYLDADTLIFDTSGRLDEFLQFSDIALIPHKFNFIMRFFLSKFGSYNVGIIGFRNNGNSEKFLFWWSENCYEWCYDFVDGYRFADQGYLTFVPLIFPNVYIIHDPGIVAAPWNISQFQTKSIGEKVYLNKSILGIYHFQGLRFFKNLTITNELSYLNFTNSSIRNLIYSKYIKLLFETRQIIYGTKSKSSTQIPSSSRLFVHTLNLKVLILNFFSIILKQYVKS